MTESLRSLDSSRLTVSRLALVRGERSSASVGTLRWQNRHPIRLEWGSGFGAIVGRAVLSQLESVTSGRSIDSGATLDVVNGIAAARYLSLHAIAQLEGSAGGTLEVRAPGERLRFEISQATPIVIELGVPPGTTRLTFHVQTGGPPDARRDEPPPTLSLDDLWHDAPFTCRL